MNRERLQKIANKCSTVFLVGIPLGFPLVIAIKVILYSILRPIAPYITAPIHAFVVVGIPLIGITGVILSFWLHLSGGYNYSLKKQWFVLVLLALYSVAAYWSVVIYSRYAEKGNFP